MSKFSTTLNKIKAHNPCCVGWRRLLKSLGKTKADDEPLEIAYILESNGLDDALWALRTLDGCERECRLLACQFACAVLPLYEKEYPSDMRPRQAIETAGLLADGLADDGELDAARPAARAAWDAASDADWDARGARDASWPAARAAWAAARAAWGARDAAWAAARGAWAAARAARDAAWDAGGASDAAWDAGDAQKIQFKAMIDGGFDK